MTTKEQLEKKRDDFAKKRFKFVNNRVSFKGGYNLLLPIVLELAEAHLYAATERSPNVYECMDRSMKVLESLDKFLEGEK